MRTRTSLEPFNPFSFQNSRALVRAMDIRTVLIASGTDLQYRDELRER